MKSAAAKYRNARDKLPIDPTLQFDKNPAIWVRHPLRSIWVNRDGNHIFDEEKNHFKTIFCFTTKNGRTPHYINRFAFECFNQVSLEGTGLSVDHINKTPSDNQEFNLRAATAIMQGMNKKLHDVIRADNSIPNVTKVVWGN